MKRFGLLSMAAAGLFAVTTMMAATSSPANAKELTIGDQHVTTFQIQDRLAFELSGFGAKDLAGAITTAHMDNDGAMLLTAATTKVFDVGDQTWTEDGIANMLKTTTLDVREDPLGRVHTLKSTVSHPALMAAMSDHAIPRASTIGDYSRLLTAMSKTPAITDADGLTFKISTAIDHGSGMTDLQNWQTVALLRQHADIENTAGFHHVPSTVRFLS